MNLNLRLSRFARSRNQESSQDDSDLSKTGKKQNNYRKLKDDLTHQFHEWVTVPTQQYITER